jgi:hypothetical protein
MVFFSLSILLRLTGRILEQKRRADDDVRQVLECSRHGGWARRTAR